MALRQTDPRFCKVMRELMSARGMSFRALAARTFHSSSYLHDLASGRKPPSKDVARRIDHALEAEGQLLALVEPDIDESSIRRFTEDMDRRSLLLSLAGLGVAPLIDRSLPDRTPPVHSPATPDDWRETAWEYGFTYMTAPRAQLLADLTADLQAVMTAMAQARSEAVRSDLADSASRIAGLAAGCCVDLGYWREARHTWRLARRLADQSGSVDTQLWVRRQEAVLGLYSGRPLPFVLDLAQQGLAIKPNARSAGAAGLSGARAQTLALLGRRAEALNALHETERISESLPESETSRSDTIFTWPEQRLHHTASYVYAFIGNRTDADDVHDRALSIYTPEHTVSRAQVSLHRAVRAIRNGDVLGGVSHATNILESLPSHDRGYLVLTIADMALSAIPAKEQRRPYVIEYRELADSLRPPPETNAHTTDLLGRWWHGKVSPPSSTATCSLNMTPSEGSRDHVDH